jgi:UDP-3-O-[3-hydroxymyristoyl] glucosamine N-acyltransferase
MQFTIRQIANLVNGEVLGDDSLNIYKFNKIEEGESGGITFLSNPKYEQFLYETQASAVIIAKDFIPKGQVSASLILVENPYLAISSLMTEYQKIVQVRKSGIEEPSFIAKTAEVGKDIFVGAFSYISEYASIGENTVIMPQVFIGKNVKIGKNTIINSGVKVLDNCVVGDHCVLHSGCVIGSDGFGFAPKDDGTYQDIPQIGNVVLESNVSIGSNTTIDRATMGSTLIKRGVKLDNLIQIAHNVEIGENTVIAAQTGVAGSTKIGKNCVIAGQVGIVGHIKIADGTKIGAQSGIGKNINEPNQSFSGSPVLPIQDYLKSIVSIRRLHDFMKNNQASQN